MVSLFDIPNPSPPKPKRAKETAKKPVPEWLAKHLEAEGLVDTSRPGERTTRRAHATHCPNCRKPIMRGLMDQPTPWAVDADPVPLSPAGEILAMLAGVKTYELRWNYDHYLIDRRDLWTLRHRPGTTDTRLDILAEHDCKRPATHWETMESRIPKHPETGVPLPEEAPF